MHVIRTLTGVLSIFLLILLGCHPQSPERLKVGDAAPLFSGHDISGKALSLEKLKGKPVVLRFFLPDCKFCKADTEIFNSFYERFHDRGLEIIYINTSPEEMKVEKFVRDLRIEFPVINDPNGEIAAKYLVRAVPQAVIIGPDSRIKGAVLGGVSEAELDQFLGPFL